MSIVKLNSIKSRNIHNEFTERRSSRTYCHKLRKFVSLKQIVIQIIFTSVSQKKNIKKLSLRRPSRNSNKSRNIYNEIFTTNLLKDVRYALYWRKVAKLRNLQRIR
jgi:hypothetical protein